jgi:hypothetical protein
MWMQWLMAGGALTAVALRLVANWFDRPTSTLEVRSTTEDGERHGGASPDR